MYVVYSMEKETREEKRRGDESGLEYNRLIFFN